jgi:hypothetical protein
MKPEGKRPFGRIKREWDDNIKTRLTETGQQNMDCLRLALGSEKWQTF